MNINWFLLAFSCLAFSVAAPPPPLQQSSWLSALCTSVVRVQQNAGESRSPPAYNGPRSTFPTSYFSDTPENGKVNDRPTALDEVWTGCNLWHIIPLRHYCRVKPKKRQKAVNVNQLAGYRSVRDPRFGTAPGSTPTLVRPCLVSKFLVISICSQTFARHCSNYVALLTKLSRSRFHGNFFAFRMTGRVTITT